MNRRTFLKAAALATFSSAALIADSNELFAQRRRRRTTPPPPTTESVFENLMKSAKDNDWKRFSIGALVGMIGQRLIGTPYVGGTLEVSDTTERCVVNLIEFDCVTFFESALCLARIIKKERYTLDDYTQELTFVRYRSGIIYNYTSRLHYTSDWIYDNVKKGVVDDITSVIGGEAIRFDVFFMSDNSELYPSLRKTPKLIGEIESFEESIKKRDYFYIPTDKVNLFADRFQTGDIICITTSKEGLDYSHVGVAIVDNGIARLLHASSREKKVFLDGTIADYLNSNKSATGITVLRPKEIAI